MERGVVRVRGVDGALAVAKSAAVAARVRRRINRRIDGEAGAERSREPARAPPAEGGTHWGPAPQWLIN